VERSVAPLAQSSEERELLHQIRCRLAQVYVVLAHPELSRVLRQRQARMGRQPTVAEAIDLAPAPGEALTLLSATDLREALAGVSASAILSKTNAASEERLRELGSDFAQGYLYSPGRPIDDVERLIIAPAVQEANRRGFHVSGPLAGDTVFFRTLQGEFDCAIAMYHDQGHVAAKMLGIWQGVNVTLGLPIIRTSVEHGTDFAHAGQGTGDPRSLVQALTLAAVMAKVGT
jgi:hypothetical protein